MTCAKAWRCAAAKAAGSCRPRPGAVPPRGDGFDDALDDRLALGGVAFLVREHAEGLFRLNLIRRLREAIPAGLVQQPAAMKRYMASRLSRL